MAIFCEDNQYIYIENKKEIDRLQIFKNSRYGANSSIYYYRNNELLKVFKKEQRIIKLCETEKINSLDTKSLLKIIKFLFINEQYYGYSMPKIKGSMLAYLDSSINLRDFLLSLTNVQEDLIMLGKNKFSADDLNVLNIIYDKNNNKTTLIDLESYGYCFEESTEYISLLNCITLYFIIFHSLTKEYNVYNSDNKLLKNIYNSIVNIDVVTESPYKFFIKQIEELENKFDKEIETISDLRKLLKK